MPPLLLLIPTEFEYTFVKERVQRLRREVHPSGKHELVVENCGFGPVLPAAITTEKIHQHRPRQIVLCGIAGAYAEASLETGSAYEFSRVSLDGVGAGQGTGFKTPSQMGWPHFSGDADRPAIGDAIELGHLIDLGGAQNRSLLTVCAAAGDRDQASDRFRRYLKQTVEAEDMEGFAVAAACQLQNVPLRITRGISNIAGDRDHNKWQIVDAMHSAMDLVERIVMEAVTDVQD